MTLIRELLHNSEPFDSWFDRYRLESALSISEVLLFVFII